jgi:hypothetical protein
MSSHARTRRWHRALGLALSLPLFLWALTGLLFHWKPGWSEAYAPLALPARPLAGTLAIPKDAGWLEVRGLATSLGEHWLVRTSAGWQHLDASLAPFPEPDETRLKGLIEEAIAVDPARYGHVTGREDGEFVTSTGAHVALDWSSLRLSQRGRDTDRIDALYRVHYLQWTGIPAIDRPFALAGLAGLVALALAGLRLARRRV